MIATDRVIESTLGVIADGLLADGLSYEHVVTLFRRQCVLAVLRRHRGNQCKAAHELGMHRNTLSRELDRLAIGPILVRRMRPKLKPQPAYPRFVDVLEVLAVSGGGES